LALLTKHFLQYKEYKEWPLRVRTHQISVSQSTGCILLVGLTAQWVMNIKNFHLHLSMHNCSYFPEKDNFFYCDRIAVLLTKWPMGYKVRNGENHCIRRPTPNFLH